MSSLHCAGLAHPVGDVPRDQQGFQQLHRVIENQADDGERDDGREHERGLHVGIGYQQQIAEPLVSSDELAAVAITFNLITAQDDIDIDLDVFQDRLELLYGSDPFSAT